MSYDKTIALLKKGPRLKSEVTRDLEKVIHLFLHPEQKAQCRFNSYGELEVAFNDRVFNLTHLLLHQPDFEHLAFTEQVSSHYETFIKTAVHIPSLKGDPRLPKKEDYLAADKNNLYSQLTYGEKLAITLYTSNFYEEINGFLRSQGRDPRLKNLPQDRLTQEVKEIILATCLAAHGLTRLQLPDDSDDNSLQTLYRAESSHKMPTTVWQQRHETIKTHKPLRQEGFISTSEDIAAMKVSGTDTLLKITQPRQGIGKKVKDLSYKADEQEILLPAGTQLAFSSFIEDQGRKVFQAFPVRSLDGIDPRSYSSVDAEIRTHLIAFLDEVRHLSTQAEPRVKTSFWQTLPHKKSETAELLAMAAQLEKLIVFFADSRHKPAEKREKLQALYKQTAKLAEQFKNLNTLHPPLQQMTTAMNHLLIQLEMANTSLLVEQADYVYSHHLSKAYKDTQLDATDAELKQNSQVVHRPNHGLAHSLRVAASVPLVVEYFQQFAQPELRKQCLQLSGDELKKVALCMLFSVSGRESDVAFKSNPQKYREYREQCALQFAAYAHKKMPSEEIKKYMELIRNMGNPDYLTSKHITPKKAALFHVMNLAHKLDLMRCYPLAQYQLAVMKGHDPLIIPSEGQQHHFNRLLRTVSERIEATGDRQFCRMEQGQLVSCTKDYDFPVFAEASTNPSECLKLILESDVLKLAAVSTTEPSPADDQIDHWSLPVLFLDTLENYTMPLLEHLNSSAATGLPAIDQLKQDSRYLMQKLTATEDGFVLLAESAYMDALPVSISLQAQDLYYLLSQMPPDHLNQCYLVSDMLERLNQFTGQLNIPELDKMDDSYQLSFIEQDGVTGDIKLTATSSKALPPVQTTLSSVEFAQCLEKLEKSTVLNLKS
ncbi:NAD-dependent ubiquitin ligase [Legionella sp. MW5194]|uniref:SidE phosphodiesterase domain-containing protein n=1 Tax=Legionella sp. MW5194 TaxID=2662448 RepID=UPI00193D8D0A|nr:SidE phosphodiesterase domain-containing protein [Legionella sp. MW5194]QRN04081.1 NAD-dependent ubiquitin ligase [Legionella sp. MW5194]